MNDRQIGVEHYLSLETSIVGAALSLCMGRELLIEFESTMWCTVWHKAPSESIERAEHGLRPAPLNARSSEVLTTVKPVEEHRESDD